MHRQNAIKLETFSLKPETAEVLELMAIIRNGPHVVQPAGKEEEQDSESTHVVSRY